MGTLIMAGQLILALAILVSLHEWGHYIASRSFGIRVEKFFIFFDAWGIKLFSKKIGDTEWGIGWLPLGGYVKISGMIDESLDEEQLASEPEDHEFRSKPAWQRLIVMIGGVTVNFILGILIFAGSLFYYGEVKLPNAAVLEKGGVYVYGVGESTGMKTGDRIVAVNGTRAENFLDLFDPINYIREGLTYTVLRDGTEVELTIADSTRKKILESRGSLRLFDFRKTARVGDFDMFDDPEESNAFKAGLLQNDVIVAIDSTPLKYYDELSALLAPYKSKIAPIVVERDGAKQTLRVEVDSTGRISVPPSAFAQYTADTVHLSYGFFESFPKGSRKGTNALWVNIVAFGEMFKGKLNPVNSVSGPIGIAKIFGPTWNWQRFWEITGMLSFILAFMNLLPIPALDGGHVLFLLIEIVRRKPLPEKVMYYFQVVGMVMLFALMAFIIFIDFFNALFR
ncbi:MAG: RIP metalloprotease RseP [Bacteroidetes bacterium]|jgi:regulator of sigma E protease|nr:RIP metalloprotease RseP [Bacteroidota bacterium]MDA8930552.1 RIP metalloprotease RseP [Bacteroidia bacterium]